MPNAGSNSIKPAESVTAYVKFKNDAYIPNHYPSELTVYWSYHANPFWHKAAEACVKQGREFDTNVVFNHVKEGPQLMFVARVANPPFGSCFLNGGERKVVFHGMVFDPNAHFEATYRLKNFGDDVELCAHGGGNKRVCDTR